MSTLICETERRCGTDDEASGWRRLLYMFDFGVEVDAEFGFDGCDYAFFETDDLFWICFSGVIHDYR